MKKQCNTFRTELLQGTWHIPCPPVKPNCNGERAMMMMMMMMMMMIWRQRWRRWLRPTLTSP